jgi:hypothetical protein
MKIKVLKEVEVKTLVVKAQPRYWEDSVINGEEDSEYGDRIPCKVGNLWSPHIDIESGKILNWKSGTTAEIHYKVCDRCGWQILDHGGNIVSSVHSEYVPKTLSPKEKGYGDYIIMDIDDSGYIKNWKFYPEDFENLND